MAAVWFFLGNLFGLPYVVMRTPKPIDTTTLNYNWQIWESNAFSVYTKETAPIDEDSAAQAVSALLRYLSRVGVVKYTCHSGYLSTAINENDLATVLTPAGGIFHALRVPGQEVKYDYRGRKQVILCASAKFYNDSKCPLRKFRRGAFYAAASSRLRQLTKPYKSFTKKMLKFTVTGI